MIVVDTSAVLEVLLRTADAQKVEGRLFDHRETLHAPHRWAITSARVPFTGGSTKSAIDIAA
jgi:hypothetical protein